MSLSLCMIVKDEEDNLPRCLGSVKDIVDEMIIVDTGSSDRTIEIAQSYGAKVFHFPWNGSFSDARNYSLKFASYDWILLMDADDELDSTYHQEILELVKADEADAYFFMTISYLGEKPGLDVMNNLNPRLLRNGKGYYFSNNIHEQIWSNITAVNPSAKILIKDIKVYHYGYLNKNIAAHNKRARNISLLEKELEEHPGYPFTLFNLGNEYFALGNNSKAIEYYEKCYSTFDPNQGFSSKLVLKLVNSYMNAGRYEDALRVSDEGLKHYPGFTDLEYMKGFIYSNAGKYLLSLKHFTRCIEMGEAPVHLNVIIGSGTYRAHYMLGDIYFNHEDYESAELHYRKSVEQCQDYEPSLVKLVKLYCIRKPDETTLAIKIEELRKFFGSKFDSLVFETLMHERYPDAALRYIEKSEKLGGSSPYLEYNKGLCNLYMRNYSTVYLIMEPLKNDSEYFSRAMCIDGLCKTLLGEYSEAALILTASDLYKNDKLLKTYLAFNTLAETGKAEILSDDKNISAEFTVIIMDLLKIILRMNEFDIFEKALNLLNLVEDKSVLLKLGKLYYNEKCFKLAYQEFMRSIKLFDIIDIEGSGMLNQLKLMGI